MITVEIKIRRSDGALIQHQVFNGMDAFYQSYFHPVVDGDKGLAGFDFVPRIVDVEGLKPA